jgi:hypothetical protein
MTESLHGDLASFVGNALSPEEDAAFAEHLAGCATCQDEVVWLSELAVAVADLGTGGASASGDAEGTAPDGPEAGDAGTAAALGAEAAVAGPGEADPVGAEVVAFPSVPDVRPGQADPAGGFPEGTRGVRAVGRTGRRTGWLVAAALMLLALGGAGGYAAGHARSTTVAAQEDPAQQLFDTGTVHRAGSASTGVHAEVAVTPSPGGVNVGLRLSDPVGPKRCELVVVGRDGEQQTAMTWSVPSGGFGAGSSAPLLARGQAGLRPDQIARFEVRSNGRALLVIPA